MPKTITANEFNQYWELLEHLYEEKCKEYSERYVIKICKNSVVRVYERINGKLRRRSLYGDPLTHPAIFLWVADVLSVNHYRMVELDRGWCAFEEIDE